MTARQKAFDRICRLMHELASAVPGNRSLSQLEVSQASLILGKRFNRIMDEYEIERDRERSIVQLEVHEMP
jgi:hypothetical protein